MTTATAHEPVTEAEIREAIESKTAADAGTVVHDLTWPVKELWTDLRPSEQEHLEVLIEPIYKLADEFEGRVIEAVVAAALTFASQHPDAPRRGTTARSPGRIRVVAS